MPNLLTRTPSWALFRSEVTAYQLKQNTLVNSPFLAIYPEFLSEMSVSTQFSVTSYSTASRVILSDSFCHIIVLNAKSAKMTQTKIERGELITHLEVDLLEN